MERIAPDYLGEHHPSRGLKCLAFEAPCGAKIRRMVSPPEPRKGTG